MGEFCTWRVQAEVACGMAGYGAPPAANAYAQVRVDVCCQFLAMQG